MAATHVNRTALAARRIYLKQALAGAGGLRVSTALLVLDTFAAIGFAAGLAGAVAALANGNSAIPWLLLAALAAIARGVCVMLAARIGAEGARAVKRSLRRRIADAAFHRPASSKRTAGELVHAVVDEVEAIDGHVARFLPARQAAALAPLVVLVAVALASPVSAAILAATLVPFIVALALAGGAAADESRRQFEALARLSSLLGDRLRALPVILAFGAQAREADRLGSASDEVARRTLRVLRIAFVSSGALEFFSALSVALVAVYCGFNLLGLLPFPTPEKLDLARAFFVLALAPEFYAPLRRLAAAYHDRQAAETAADRLAEIESERVTVEPVAYCPAVPSLSFSQVSIRYDADAVAVRDFSLEIAPGETIALVGPSGSGKSSLLHLLLGLAPLSGGMIRLDGRVLPRGGSIARHAAWLGQSTLIIPGTIAANIALANRAASEEEIALAAKAAGLHAMLAGRPEGLETILDERGSGLSGGERRRIGLARALLKPAPILLLDEPSSHLDHEAEAQMIASIRAARKGRTVLLATHSPVLAAIADRVITLEPAA